MRMAVFNLMIDRINDTGTKVAVNPAEVMVYRKYDAEEKRPMILLGPKNKPRENPWDYELDHTFEEAVVILDLALNGWTKKSADQMLEMMDRMKAEFISEGKEEN